MIISKAKPKETVLNMTKREKSFFLLGCGECASLCGTGNEEALKAMTEALEAAGKKVTGMFIPKTGCQVLGTKLEIKPFKEQIEQAEAIIVMSCGAGTQTAVELFPDRPVYPANDTSFLGNMTRFQYFDERCSMCGECILDRTGGVCPVTLCPKGILNGPCGGTNNGKCEANPELDCAWTKIYMRLKAINRLDDMKQIIEPKDHTKHQKPSTHIMERKKEAAAKK